MPLAVFPESDAKLFTKWMWRQKESSNFDPAVIAAPRTCMVKASQDGQTIALLPVQPVLSLESLCNDENLTKSQLTLALYEIHVLIKKIMRDSECTEAYFTTSHDEFAELCEANGWKRHLFDEKKHTWLMRLQLPSDLLGKLCELP
jgi:hypothetical protein